MENHLDDFKRAAAGSASIFALAFSYKNEIGFIFASSISVLTMVYLVQGIIIRKKDLDNLKNK